MTEIYHAVSEDTFIHEPAQLVMYLCECAAKDQDAIIDFHLEGPCFERNGLYRLLDDFCSKTNYPGSRITVKTSNLLEHHHVYRVEHVAEYWYEVREINRWVSEHSLPNTGTQPRYHFASFVGRSDWCRLWLSALLDSRYADKTLLTFNSSLASHYVVKEKDGIFDTLGLDDLNQHRCDILPQVADFLTSCPRVISQDLDDIKNIKPFYPGLDDYYPIVHPANLNLLKHYHSIFVEIICETRVSGNTFAATEKIWRCIIAGRPFIVMASANYLANLRRLGFQTFDNFWDEGYDDYCDRDRVLHIADLIDTLSSKTLEELSVLLSKMQPVLEHNKKVFQQLTYSKLLESFGHDTKRSAP